MSVLNSSLSPVPFGPCGTFADRNLERDFQTDRWRQDSSRMRFVCLITGLAEGLGMGVDAVHFSGRHLAIMLISRLLTMLVAVAAVRLTLRAERPRSFLPVLTGYMLAAGLVETMELWLLQPLEADGASFTVILVLVFYLFLPPRLGPAMVGALATSAIYLLVMGLASPVRASDVYAFGLFFALANGFGIYFLLRFGRSLRREYWVRRELTRVNGALLRQIAATDEANRRLAELANTDALTGAMSRRRFFEVLDAEFQRIRRYGGELSLIMFDLDQFKTVNDRFGHAAGDAALVRLSRLCRSNRRTMDAFGRVGGDEFVLLLPETGLSSARAVAERIRGMVAGAELEVPGGRVRVTLSAGVAAYVPSDADGEALLHRADEALYEAKREGRDRVSCPGAE